MYASCIFVDSTHNVTLHKNFKQFSVCVKDSNGHFYTVCRIGVPNEKVCMLTYILQVCLPSLFGPEFCLRVRLIICDGDIWLCDAIDRAIGTTYQKAIRGRCGFHIVYFGFEKNIRGRIRYHDNVPDNIKTEFEELIQTWLYSWMCLVIFTEAEYELSKNILLQWLQSKEVLENICDQASDLLVRWIKIGVIVHENVYVFHRRSDIFAMDSYTNCGIEGTHNALKNGAISVGRKDELHEFTKKVTDYDESRMREHYVEATRILHSTKLYGKKWMNHLTDKGAKLVYNTMKHSDHYVSEVVREENGDVCYYVMIAKPTDGECKSEEEDHEHNVSSEKIDLEQVDFTYRLPQHVQYIHAWTVKIVKEPSTGELYLVCSCLYYHRCGLLCTHLHHVHENYFRKRGYAEEIDYHDYHVVWWKFCVYLIRKPVEKMTEAEKDALVALLHSANTDKRMGLHLHLSDGCLGEACFVEDEGVLKGAMVKIEDCMHPSKVAVMTAQERLIGWNWDYKSLSGNEKTSTTGMIPIVRVEDHFRSKKLDEKISDILTHQQCRKDSLAKVHGIADCVDFSKCPEFYTEFSETLDDMYAKAVRINLNRGQDLSKHDKMNTS
ncbi:hypothetical protein CTEN210_07215 [Chaetoceros tenuissimus]|uniref:SWIM-type domain-containing protein n=1 Tax=Chaetoceros tenuissimus TaxID=426638 RepID=A0AAD3CS14_9STRA|nr:hypothetical protein CTEN210_07215 [Chaetoceros tenuissimus]